MVTGEETVLGKGMVSVKSQKSRKFVYEVKRQYHCGREIRA